MSNKKLIIIGLDGATWDLIKLWVEEGHLPAFKKLREGGVWGDLKSTTPPVTAPAWASFLTGMNPGKTGIYDFFKVDEFNPPKMSPVSGAMIRNKTMLEYLSKFDIKVGSLNIPMTYPPFKVNGFVVSGMETPAGRDFAYPQEIQKLLEDMNYQIEPDVPYTPGNEDKFLNAIYKQIDNRERALFELMNYDYDFMVFLFRETDAISHTFWKFFEKKHQYYDKNAPKKYKDAMLNVYKKADSLIKKVMDNMAKDDILMVVSDHGFGPEFKRVNLNLFLIKKGYISFKNSLCVNIKRKINEVISPSRVWNAISSLKLPFNFIGKIKELEVDADNTGKQGLSSKIFLSFDDVDWKNTTAYSWGCIGGTLPVYINKEKIPIDKYPELLNNIKKDLNTLIREDGKKVVNKISEKTEIYNGKKIENAPDLTVEFIDGYVGFALRPPFITEGNELFVNSPLTQTGAHRQYGIFVAYGKDIKSGVEIKNANIIDVAPTVIYLFGLPIPNEIDGKVLKDIFKESSEIVNREVEYQEVEKEKIKRSIMNLKTIHKL